MQQDSRLSWPARTRFASGDFACNLYWQSSSLFLFFFYTDVLHLGPQAAGLVCMIGSISDGIADLLAGVWADRGYRSYARLVGYGAIPLGLSFPLLYCAPPLHGAAFDLMLLGAQLLFRSLYALVNVPYAAWSARITTASSDRAAIAGLRMLFGTLAAAIVPLATARLSLALTNRPMSGPGFLAAAVVFALVATPLLIYVARRTPEGVATAAVGPAISLRRGLRVLVANRAFVTLCVAMVSIVLAATILSRSVLYYFAYVVGDGAAGSTALALMGVAGSVFVPLWMAVRHRTGSRVLWLGAVALALASASVFALTDTAAAWRADLFLIAMQAALAAFSFVFWAMLPDTVEYGEYRSGVRIEALAFGVAALVQKVAIGAAAGLTGFAYAAIGYAPHVTQPASVVTGIRWIMVAAPIVGGTLSALAMIANPLRRDTHRHIVAALAQRAAMPSA